MKQLALKKETPLKKKQTNNRGEILFKKINVSENSGKCKEQNFSYSSRATEIENFSLSPAS